MYLSFFEATWPVLFFMLMEVVICVREVIGSSSFVGEGEEKKRNRKQKSKCSKGKRNIKGNREAIVL